MTSKSKAQARYEIDAKRAGVDPSSKDALPRSREFIRLDSTYYVGWMYEGMYKYDRSADYLGYKNAIIPLQKAFDLIENDYGKAFHTLYNNVNNLIANFNRYQDLYMIFSALKFCYDNVEMPDKSMQLIDRIQAYNLKNDIGFELSYQRSWMYHRNRFLTSKDYSFLKNSVQENEKMAFQWCYAGLAFINRYKADNDAIWGPAQSEERKLTIYHNLALLHCYNKNYDSSEYYYQRLADGGRVSWNNFGGMQSEIGNFAIAQQYFTEDKDKSFERFLREPYYYLPELYIYAGKTKEAIQMCNDIITASGSTPGFGWYNIALARSYLYDAQLDSAEAALNKAANFKELHIGTTLTQSQYEFTINLLRIQLFDKKIEQEKFLNNGWWYSPTSLYNIATYKAQKMTAEYIVVNQLTYNPERDRLLYDLFCAEATTSFDEAWYLMKDFSPKYFIDKYTTYQQTDKRNNIQRYFKLFAAKFKWEKGDEKDALKDLENIDRISLVDTANEKLFIARLYEGLVKAYDDNGNKNRFSSYSNALYEDYPQLLPFTGIKTSVKLSVSGTDDAVIKDVVDEIKDCNINTSGKDATLSATIIFNKRGSSYEAVITVRSANGVPVVNNERLIFKKADGAGKEIALRMFGKGGSLVYDPEPAKQ
ncbi:hypothetical protein FRZ67_20830 [Panacibacter ginsenosidivorans]|uniref:Tetratricopeptide repeat protein n=1 Tax=Panacibacter ginsenosidivorans TaxID=1813871 RepID=A0A5B8VDL8_9BACT|nr:hypothetical protein [Panacibacter ginsenosidivorans]QEC69627.1 hypothetical protein FRZ67_20830 [Panacibacter ginsenosidivorans]